ncbi:MAG: DUF1343 domain-containing protein [Ignavibacteriae bacterium]|nr:DUF1343 domain-containing protein [Ignavibacteriota bacterium]
MKSRNSLVALLILLLLSSTCAQPKVKLGNDVLVEKHLDMLKGKRVGLIINHTAQLSSGKFLVDELMEKKINVVALFGPEHGVRGEAQAGDTIKDGRDAKTGIPIFSLYGATRKPSPEMLTNVDVLVYDVQDVGARFYTYISTMGLCMEAAAAKGIPFIVLDRPNPLGGQFVDGPIIEDSLTSFVGMYPIPVAYGLTCGELATMINNERWLESNAKCSLTVMKMEGWKRRMVWDDTGLRWIPPSPNIKTSEAALLYQAMCLVEATNLSEGRGTEKPFQYIGAPFVNGDSLSSRLTTIRLAGVKFTPISFTPNLSKHRGELCRGVFVELSMKSPVPLATGISLLQQLLDAYPTQVTVSRSWLAKLVGTTKSYDDLMARRSPMFAQAVARFRKLSKKYWLY